MGPQTRILGSLKANDSLAFVLVLEHFDKLPSPHWPNDQTQTYTFRRVQGRWLSMLDGKLGEVGSGIDMFEHDDCPGS
jgi:hypothetical protein